MNDVTWLSIAALAAVSLLTVLVLHDDAPTLTSRNAARLALAWMLWWVVWR